MRVAVRTAVAVMFSLLFAPVAVTRGADAPKPQPNLGAKPPEGAVIGIASPSASAPDWVSKALGSALIATLCSASATVKRSAGSASVSA